MPTERIPSRIDEDYKGWNPAGFRPLLFMTSNVLRTDRPGLTLASAFQENRFYGRSATKDE